MSRKKIESETKRVIVDHLPTVFAAKGWVSVDNIDPHELAERLDQLPKKISEQINKYFALADSLIEQAGKTVGAQKNNIETFKLFFRQLYTVASIESHIAAIESGRNAALKITGSQEEAIIVWSVTSRSGGVFFRNFQRLSGEVQSEGVQVKPRVILILDDVAHSGDQMRLTIHDAKQAYASLPVVVSLGVTTTRALEAMSPALGPSDQIIYHSKRPCLKELIADVPSPVARMELIDLARNFFTLQGYKSIENAMMATHIITPFKLPDSTSNGVLGQLYFDQDYLSFTGVGSKDRIYPWSF